jgi:thiol-disulfide isomerase/thioredoxin
MGIVMRKTYKPGPHRITAALAVTLIALLTLAACGRGSGLSYPTTPLAPETSSQAGGESAPNFMITAYQGEDVLGGKEVAFSSLVARGKPVVLNFWAGLCPPCRAEMPDFQKLYSRYKDRITLFGLDVGPFVGLGTRQDGQALLKELNVTFPAGTTFDQSVVRDFGVFGMPTTVFITSDGRVFKKWTGLLNFDKMVSLTEELLQASKKR